LEAKIAEIFSATFSLSRGAWSLELLVVEKYWALWGDWVLGRGCSSSRQKSILGALDWNWGISLRFLLERSPAAVAIRLRLVD
jgi:hypothetical protein